MKTACPNCGAEIEFRYDDSFVRICDHCSHAVQRTDRGLETLGKVADLVPIESPLRLFAEGHVGSTSFLLVGMAQIRHAAGGIWQEWYAKLDGGRWGWLAEAQGRYYLTFQDEGWQPVDLRELAPGHTVALPVHGASHAMTVAEATAGTYVSARGELPYKLVPGETFHYADLADGKGAFATIDYGDGEAPPALYVGTQVALAELGITGGEAGPPEVATITSKRLACPNCNAPIDLHAAEQSQRAVCTHCNALLDLASGELAVLALLKQKPHLQIPLGTKGTFIEGELTVIGYLQRSAYVANEWWPFEEYLLYRPGLGFRWLVESDGHWSYVQPIAPGAVDASRASPVYDKVSFRLFQQAELRVDQVLGEVYWEVKVGETVSSQDFIAPPAMLSVETTPTEENWSLSTYLTAREVRAAFPGTDLAISEGSGIAPNQPDPWSAASSVMAIAFLVLILAGIVFAIAAKDTRTYDQLLSFTPQGPSEPPPRPTPPPVDVPQVGHDLASLDDANRAILAGSGSAAGSGGSAALEATPAGSDAATPNVIFSDPIAIEGGQNIELQFSAPMLINNWVYVAADLVDQATGAVVNTEASLEYYEGIDDGESWSEGTHSTKVDLGPEPAGSYMIRFEGQAGPKGPESVHVEVRQGVFRGGHLALAMLALGFPLGLVGVVSYFHERRRWENSSSGKPPFSSIGLLVLLFGGVFLAIGAIIKALASSSSSDD